MNSQPLSKSKNSYLKLIILSSIIFTLLFLTVVFYFNVVLNKPLISFFDANAQDNTFNKKEIFLTNGSVQLNWDNFKYDFMVNGTMNCFPKRDWILLSYFQKKIGKTENCFLENSEEYFLYSFLINKENRTRILDGVTNSKQITEERKNKINIIISNSKIREKKSELIIFEEKNINLASAIELYTSMEKNGNRIIQNVNYINLLLGANNYIGAIKQIKELFKTKKEELILFLNEYFYRSEFDQFYKFILTQKNKKKEFQLLEDNQEILEKYFDLFIDIKKFDTSFSETMKINLDQLLFSGLNCGHEKNTLFNMVLFRKCLLEKLKLGQSTEIVMFKIRQLGDDSLNTLWQLALAEE